jgi:hypothetical protein
VYVHDSLPLVSEGRLHASTILCAQFVASFRLRTATPQETATVPFVEIAASDKPVAAEPEANDDVDDKHNALALPNSMLQSSSRRMPLNHSSP